MTAFDAIQRELLRYPGEARFDDGYYGIRVGAPFARLSIDELKRVFERSVRDAELLVFVQDLDLGAFIDGPAVIDERQAFYSIDAQLAPLEAQQRAARVQGAQLQARLFETPSIAFVFRMNAPAIYHAFAGGGLVFAPTPEELAVLTGEVEIGT